MKLKHSIILLSQFSIIIFLSSCSLGDGQIYKTKDFGSYDEYLETLESLSYDKMKKKLVEDDLYLTSLIDTTDVHFYWSMGFGSGSSIPLGSSELVSEVPFKLPEIDSVKKIFKSLTKDAYFEQELGFPNTSIYFKTLEDELFGNEITDSILSVYINGEAKNINNVGMALVDSITATYSTYIDKGLDSLSVQIEKKKSKKYQYNGFEIKIDCYGDGSLEMDIPLEIHKNILAYQALDSNNVRQNPNSFSSFPIYNLNRDIENNILEFKKNIAKALKAKDKKTALNEIRLLEDKHFLAIESLNSFVNKLLILRKEIDGKTKNASFNETVDFIGELQQFVEDNSEMFGVYKMQVELEFPEDYNELKFYFGNEKEKITSNPITVSTEESSYEESEEYVSYYDSELEKYGVYDLKNHKILIKADFEEELSIEKENGFNGLFLFENSNSNYFFDFETNEMKKLEKDYSYLYGLKSGVLIISDSLNYEGLINQKFETILSPQYESLDSLSAKYTLATSSKLGRKYAYVLDENYKVLNFTNKKGEKMALIDISYLKYWDTFYALDIYKNAWFFDKNGKVIQKSKFNKIDIHDENAEIISYYEYGKYGFLSGKGESLTEPIYNELGFYSEGKLDAYITTTSNDDGYAYNQKKCGYIDKKGNWTISPSFKECYSFNGGFALVFYTKDEDYKMAFIDAMGNIIKEYAEQYLDETEGEGKNTIYTFEDFSTNYKGDLIKTKNNTEDDE